MIQNFITFLCNPSNGNSLIFRDNKLADTATGKEFDCVGNVAILLEKSDENLPSSTTHEKLNTTFNYRDHYQKDAEFFNYFDKRQDRETTQENHRLHQTIWRTQKKHSRIVLDVGCGGGWVAKMALQEKLKVLSMDISTINPTEAVKRYNSPDHMGLVADAFHLPIKTNTIGHSIYFYFALWC